MATKGQLNESRNDIVEWRTSHGNQGAASCFPKLPAFWFSPLGTVHASCRVSWKQDDPPAVAFSDHPGCLITTGASQVWTRKRRKLRNQEKFPRICCHGSRKIVFAILAFAEAEKVRQFARRDDAAPF